MADDRDRDRQGAVVDPLIAQHEHAMGQVRDLVPVLRAAVDELDHHVQRRRTAAADFRRAQESHREG